jgi:hypothetical protein
LTQAVVVARPRRERDAFVVQNLDLIETGVVVVAAEIKIDKVVVVELASELQGLLRRLGFKEARRIIRRGKNSAL